jgi:hypothetical protein
MDLSKPLEYPPRTVDEIYACHIIEHFTRLEWFEVLPSWAKALAQYGKLVIEAPDIMVCMNNFIADKFGYRWGWWHKTIYGDDDKGMRHKQGFTIPRLRAELESVGLTVTSSRRLHHDQDPDQPAMQYNFRVEAVKA